MPTTGVTSSSEVNRAGARVVNKYSSSFSSRNVFNRPKFAKFNLIRFVRTIKLQPYSLRKQPSVAARVSRLIRSIKATPLMRRQ